MKIRITEQDILRIVQGWHGSPREVLGMVPSGKGLIVRTFQPFARCVDLIGPDGQKVITLGKKHADGLFEGRVKDHEPFAYKFHMTGFDDHEWTLDDPYRFPVVISDFDLYLFGEGTHYRTYKHMGAHAMTIDGVSGVHFAVWAPNAERMSVIGEFNRWDGRHHPMESRGDSGLWELFIPALQAGDLYKFEVKGPDMFMAQKADPYAFSSELRPRTASMVWDLDAYEWNDGDWMDTRSKTNWLKKPISVYEVHLGSWMRVADDHNRWLTYRELADKLIPYASESGFTHIELLPVSEHPFDGSWGYQTIGYYAPTSRFGSPDDFKYFIDRCHQAGLAVLIDWVPAHFPKDGHGLGYFDGTHLYEHSDPRQGEHRDWGTLIFNYGRNEVKTFLLSNALFLADVYHIDGLRVDAVASMLYLDYSREDGEWIPNKYGGRENLEAIEFLKTFNTLMHEEYPGFTTFAEESTDWPMVSRPVHLGGLGFTFKWNMGWMHDTLEYFAREPIHRKYHHGHLTFSLLYAFTENFILPFSHDEVVHGKGSMLDKMPGDLWQKYANLRLLYSYMYAHPGKKLLFMGSEFGQWCEWDCNNSLDWHLLEYDDHRKMLDLMRVLNVMYRDVPALHQEDFSWDGFEWIDLHDSDQSILSFIRKATDPVDNMVCAYNFTPVVREGYRLGVPALGVYEEVLNTDASRFGGSGVGNAGLIHAEAIPWMNQNYSIQITMPPLAGVWLKPLQTE